MSRVLPILFNTDIRDRCNNKNNSDYKYYGGRSITVCAEWNTDFKPFYDWSMENGYSDELTIDRIDVNGNYEPNNCRWVTRKAQTRNRNITRTALYEGQMRPISEIAEIEGISYQKAYSKYARKGMGNRICAVREAGTVHTGRKGVGRG